MPEHGFRNRWGALVAVVILAAVVVAFVGRDGMTTAVTGKHTPEVQVDEGSRKGDPAQGVVTDTPTDSSQSDETVEWSDGDDLIDDTAGIDPSPPDMETDDEGTVVEVDPPAQGGPAPVAQAPDGANNPSDGGNP